MYFSLDKQVLTHSLKHFEIECLGPFCLQSFLRIQRLQLSRKLTQC
ncbi:hypothetical protein LOK49_LG11G00155 [Camellia lanceoleosa]|uniref:Uncharacterized protein n=1 Tax=Camellia lanceoleosa TaxID=1840588 RepID=A0ACC0FXD3_9ERIC|nr:hypothetical protein LOK49_LG11G00155 [Camellia lanceoleosa]